MLAVERRNQILAKLQEEKRVVVSELSQLFQVTEETIRRDLEKLEQEGMAKKTYGGAILNESFNIDLPYTVRKKANVFGKQYIAERIGIMIEDGSHIILDASSTALFIARKMKEKKHMTVITNSVEILLELSDQTNWKILSTGGALKEDGLALVGYQAERMIQNYHVDLAVFSCNGIDLEYGLTDSNEQDAEIKKAMIKSARKKILAVDHTKFDKVSFTKICDLSEIDLLVTDREPSAEWKQAFGAEQIEVVFE